MSAKPGTRISLQRRITFGLVAYLVLLGVGVVAFGWIVHEAAEQRAWESILRAELANYRRLSAEDRNYRWSDTESLELQVYAADDRSGRFAALDPGLHDEVEIDGVDYVVLVEADGDRRWVLALDISAIERQERGLASALIVLAILIVILLVISVAWGVGRLSRPLRTLAAEIGAIRPEVTGTRLPLDPDASIEQATVTNALNDFLDRSDAFVERERAFIDIASHELRTPITVIAGAAELALAQPGLIGEARGQVLRIQRAAAGVERLLPLLLTLAKAPERLTQLNHRFRLDELLPEIVDDHAHLLRDKALQIEIADLPGCELNAPMNIVQAAISNLLRNAIENSDSGTIRIRLEAAATLRIEDPGHQMSPEQLSQLYARLARGKGRHGGGIGLELIARLCTHFRWQLGFETVAAGGTLAVLDLRASLAEPGPA